MQNLVHCFTSDTDMYYYEITGLYQRISFLVFFWIGFLQVIFFPMNNYSFWYFLCPVYLSYRTEAVIKKCISGKNQKLDKAISNHFFWNIVAVSIFQWNSFYILWPNWHFSIFLAIFEAPLGLQVYLTHANPQGQLGLNLFFL